MSVLNSSFSRPPIEVDDFAQVFPDDVSDGTSAADFATGEIERAVDTIIITVLGCQDLKRWDLKLKHRRLKRWPVKRLDAFEPLIAAVKLGEGVAIGPEVTIGLEVANPSLAALKVEAAAYLTQFMLLRIDERTDHLD